MGKLFPPVGPSTGAVTPVAVLDPVEISGTTVSHASVHNWDQVARLGLGPGDRVLVEKAGEIIPQILGVTEKGKGKPFKPPTECPFCQSAAIVTTSHIITTESYWRCTKCGDLWNTARSQPAPNRWGYYR